MDFSFFGDEVVEEVKQYAADTTQSAKASLLPDPFKATPPTIQPKVPSAEVQPVEAAEVQPVGAAPPLS